MSKFTCYSNEVKWADGRRFACLRCLCCLGFRPCLALPCPASWQPVAALSRLVKHDFAFYTFANLLSQHFSFTCRGSLCPGSKGPLRTFRGKGRGLCNRLGLLKVLWHNSLDSPGPTRSDLCIYLFINACPIRGHPRSSNWVMGLALAFVFGHSQGWQ